MLRPFKHSAAQWTELTGGESLRVKSAMGNRPDCLFSTHERWIGGLGEGERVCDVAHGVMTFQPSHGGTRLLWCECHGPGLLEQLGELQLVGRAQELQPVSA